MLSQSEENYLKSIFKLSGPNHEVINTNAIAELLDTKASSVTDMLKKLQVKKLVVYKKYQGVQLSQEGEKAALIIIRKHRLWETFLVDKLHFKWDEVHEIAEQLEHVSSKELTHRLDAFLDFPKKDPHGDPIPDQYGNIHYGATIALSDTIKGHTGIIYGVNDLSGGFLQYLEHNDMVPGNQLTVLHIHEFDGSMMVRINGKEIGISSQVASNVFIKE